MKSSGLVTPLAVITTAVILTVSLVSTQNIFAQFEAGNAPGQDIGAGVGFETRGGPGQTSSSPTPLPSPTSQPETPTPAPSPSQPLVDKPAGSADNQTQTTTLVVTGLGISNQPECANQPYS